LFKKLEHLFKKLERGGKMKFDYYIFIGGENNKVVRESKLKEDSLEYKLSLVIDTLLNIERLKK
jgi:hypothetical protein